jgi:DNA-binding MarR family transcriptional regulator
MKNKNIKYPFGFDKPADSPGFLLWQTTTMWQRQIKIGLEPFGLSHAQFVILALLMWMTSQNQRVTQTQLGSFSKLDKMTISQSLKALVEKGFVDRQEHPTDTRAKCVLLTKAGKALIHQVVPIVEAIDSAFFGDLDGEDQQSLLKVLSCLNA